MNKINSLAFVALIGLTFAACSKENNEVEEAKNYTLSINVEEANYTHLGTDMSQPVGYYFQENIAIDHFVLTHSFADWGFGEGFTYTNCTDVKTPGYTNLSAITGKGVKGNTYFTANTGGSTYPGGMAAQITFAEGKAYKAVECYVTNSTYAYLAIKDQNDGAGLVKEWTKDDKFTLIITGYNQEKETGKIEYLLADGLTIVNSWECVDLSKLGTVTKLQFELTSTDAGEWGMNTPSYFCLDRLTVKE